MRLIMKCSLLGVLWMIPVHAKAQDAATAAQQSVSWRNYRRVAAPFSADSSECDARASVAARGMSGAARTEEFLDCLGRRGWNPMRVVVGGASCSAVALQPTGTDSASVAPLLAELTATLTRRFRPAAPNDTAARLIITVSSNDIRARTPGIYESRIPLGARLAVAGAKSIDHATVCGPNGACTTIDKDSAMTIVGDGSSTTPPASDESRASTIST